ncbi:MAG: protein DA1 [Spirochaetales bacterium]|nr:protein DA1 [Spirochaetales bacterium]
MLFFRKTHFVLALALTQFAACQLIMPTCKFCGKSVRGAEKVHTPEGFEVCHQCNQEAVRDLRTAQALVAQARTEMVNLGIRLPWGAIPIKLEKAAGADTNQYGRCEAGRYANGTVAFLLIRIMPGLPRPLFKAVAVHELTHAWAYLHRSPQQQDLVLSEGAPTLVEYTYLERDTSPSARFRRHTIETSGHDVYSKGTQRLQTYARDHGGLAGVLTLLRSSQKIPEGY